MRTTVTLDDDVYESATRLARASHRGLGEVLSDLARRGLAGTGPAPKDGPSHPSAATNQAENQADFSIDDESLF